MRKKVLIIQEYIPHYRVPIFNILGGKYDLTVTSTKSEQSNIFIVKSIVINKYGPFNFINGISHSFLAQFDIVIFTFNIRFLNLYFLLLIPNRKYKLILWGIGVTSELGFDTSNRYDALRYLFARKTDAVIFYSEYPKEKYFNKGNVNINKMFVARNTLAIKQSFPHFEKKYFLFIGTLKKYKRIEDFIELYYRAYVLEPNLMPLYIIGDGDFMETLKLIIYEKKLSHKVKLFGEITIESELQEMFKYAIACLSPYQAGLAVLQSLAYSVPFITLSNSITGGERFNIINGETGYLPQNEIEYIDTVIKLNNDMELCYKLCVNAHNYFSKNCKLENMLSGFTKAIDYVSN